MRDDTKTAARESRESRETTFDCRTCRMMSQVYNMKGPGHKDRLIRHFVFIAVHIAIVPATSARCIQSIICIGETLRN